MNLYAKKALGGLLLGGATTLVKHFCTKYKSPIATNKDWTGKIFNRDTFNIIASTIPLMLIKSTPIGVFSSIGLSVFLNFYNKTSNSNTNDSTVNINKTANTDNQQKNELETKHASIISTIETYNWTEDKDVNGKNARFGGKHFWDNNKAFLEEMGLKAKNFYTDYVIPGKVCPEAFHDGFMYPNCSVSIEDNVLHSARESVMYRYIISKEHLWDIYYMGAPARHRKPVESYKIVKRA